MSTSFAINPTFCFTLLGSFAIYLWTRPPRAFWLAALALAFGLRVACIRLMGGLGAYYGVRWISWGAFLGIASIIVLAVQVVLAPRSERVSLRRTFFAASVFPLCALLIGYFIPLTIWLRPKTYDAFLLAFDGGLGFQPSFVLGRLLVHHATLWGATTIVYYALPVEVAILYAAYRALPRQPVALLALMLCLMVVGDAQYGIFPAVGPAYAFRESYPLRPPPLAQIAAEPITVPEAPRNCMPSLHLAGALLAWWNSRIWPRWGRVLTFLFLLATAFATLALGEHYLADLVVAFPFSLILQAAWTQNVKFTQTARQSAFWWGWAVTATWLVLLRYFLGIFLISPLVPWGAILATVGGSLWLEGKLSAAIAWGLIHNKIARHT
jgi:hypothetical protein